MHYPLPGEAITTPFPLGIKSVWSVKCLRVLVYGLSLGLILLVCSFVVQIRRSLLNEDEYGFRKARRPMYYDEGLEVITY